MYEANHGRGRPIISTEFKDWRVVAVGNAVHFAKKEKTPFFSDFISRYLREHLGFAWGEAELERPPEKRHEIIKWFAAVRDHIARHKPNENGAIRFEPTGAVRAWFGLAYDLYLIKHNAELQKEIINRLRQPEQFQGARFELCVTAAMVVAGFKIEYEDERDRSRRHAEFIATHPSGLKIAVEAKSRHRDGVLGFKSPGAALSDKVAVEGLIRDALAKKPDSPYLIFVDVNLPALVEEASEQHPWWREMHETQRNLQLEWEPGTFPANSLFFYNDASHYGLLEKMGKNPVWCYEVPAEQSAFPLPPKLTMEIAAAMLQRSNVPQHFPNA